ncbi:hypothetical protein ACOMHN_027656 [Nucella lapillus]
MHAVSAAILLTAVVLAQADQMSDLLHLPAHKEHFYIFEVTSEASVYDLKAALANFTLGGSYQVIGEKHYFFLFSSNDIAALRSLTFPKGSKVTQHAVEYLDEYLEMFGAEGGFGEHFTEDLPDTVLMFLQYELKLPKTLCSKTLEMEIKEWAREANKTYHIVKPRIYPVIASYPPMYLVFLTMPENALQNVVEDVTAPALEGLGRIRLS